MEDLWGEVKELDIQTPIQILKLQAQQINTKTKGILVGQVMISKDPAKLGGRLMLVAPALNGYFVTILEAFSSHQIYPATIRNLVEGTPEKICVDEVDFKSALRDILSSQNIMNIVSTLIAQSKSTS